VAGPSGFERGEDEDEVAARQAARARARLWITARHDQPAGDVIHAIAMLAPGDTAERMLEQAPVVGKPFEVNE
jgi:hypothetical protein